MVNDQKKVVKELLREINDLCSHIQYIDTLIKEEEDGSRDRT